VACGMWGVSRLQVESIKRRRKCVLLILTNFHVPSVASAGQQVHHRQRPKPSIAGATGHKGPTIAADGDGDGDANANDDVGAPDALIRSESGCR